MHTQIHIQIQSHKLSHTHTCKITYAHVHTYTHTHSHTRTHARTHTHTHTHINTSKTKKRIPHSCPHVKTHTLIVAGASNSVTIQAVDLVSLEYFLQISSHFRQGGGKSLVNFHFDSTKNPFTHLPYDVPVQPLENTMLRRTLPTLVNAARYPTAPPDLSQCSMRVSSHGAFTHGPQATTCPETTFVQNCVLGGTGDVSVDTRVVVWRRAGDRNLIFCVPTMWAGMRHRGSVWRTSRNSSRTGSFSAFQRQIWRWHRQEVKEANNEVAECMQPLMNPAVHIHAAAPLSLTKATLSLHSTTPPLVPPWTTTYYKIKRMKILSEPAFMHVHTPKPKIHKAGHDLMHALSPCVSSASN